MSEFVVHTIPGSPFARAVMATLEEKGAPWRLAAMNPGEHKQPAHLERQPFGRMPAVEHDGFRLYETQAILRYIDRVCPKPALTPTDPWLAARMDQAMSVNDWYLFPGCANVIAFQRLIRPILTGLTPDEAAIAEAMPGAHRVIAELSRLLAGQPYFAGDHLTLADLTIAPQLDFLSMTPEWGPLTHDKPQMNAWLARMQARPSMQATTWEKVRALAA